MAKKPYIKITTGIKLPKLKRHTKKGSDKSLIPRKHRR